MPDPVWTIPDPVPESVYDSIASQVIANANPATVYPQSLMVLALKSWHVQYQRTAAGGMTIVNGVIVDWGDCGSPGNAGVPTGGIQALSDVSRGIGAAVGVSGGAVAAIGGTAAASAAGLGLLNVVPVVGTIAALALLPFEIISAHHAQAVANEQNTNCGCWLIFNQWLDAIDQAVMNGSLLPAEGVSAVQQIYQEAVPCVAAVSKPCTPGNVNAACDLKAVAEGIVLLRQWMYSNLPQFNPAQNNPVASLLSGSSSGTIPGTSSTTGAAAAGSGSMFLVLAVLAVLFLLFRRGA